MSRRRGSPAAASAFLLTASLTLCLAGCAVGPDYRAPAIATSPAFRATPLTTAGGEPPRAVSPDWWRAFNDPILDELETRAIGQNLDLAAAVARISQARAAAKAAGAALLPAAQANGQAARAYSSVAGTNAYLAHVPGYSRANSLYDLTAGTSWEIDLFGELRRGAEAARADLAAAGADVAGARLLLAADVATAYIQLRADQRRLGLAGDQIAADARLLELVRLRFSEGQAARREVDSAEASLGQAQALQPLLRLAVEAQLNRLAVLTGVSPEADRGVLERPAPIPTAPPPETAAPRDLLRARPDLIAAERRLAAANARIGAAISDYYPKVSLQSLAGWDAASAGAMFTNPAAEAQGALGLRWRLFDFGRVDAQVANARGAEAAALAAYRQGVLRACEDVENALTARLERAGRAEDLRRTEAALRRSRQAAGDAYEAGTLSLMEVVDADRQLLAVQDDAAQADAETALAAVALVRALGG